MKSIWKRIRLAKWRLRLWLGAKAWAWRTITHSIARDGLEGAAMLIDAWTAVRDAVPAGDVSIALDHEGGSHYALFHPYGDRGWCWNVPNTMFWCAADGAPDDKGWCITHWMKMPEDFEAYCARETP